MMFGAALEEIGNVFKWAKQKYQRNYNNNNLHLYTCILDNSFVLIFGFLDF